MALIHSHSVGGGKKSAGLVTYRKVRGRIIMSQKRQGSDASMAAAYSNEGKLNVRCANFAMINAFIAAHRNSINNSFEKTKYGSQGNMFYKVNRVALEKALAPFAQQGGEVTLSEIEAAIAAYAQEHPTDIYRVKLAKHDPVFLAGGWDDAEDPVAEPILATMSVNISEDYKLTSVVVTGSNLNPALKVLLGSVMVGGEWNIDTYGTQATFTPATQAAISGLQTIAVKWGNNTLLSRQISGDTTVAVSRIDLATSDAKITKATIYGSNLSANLVCKYAGNVVPGTMVVDESAASAVFTPTTPITRSAGTSQFAVYSEDGNTLLNSTNTTYTPAGSGGIGE